MGEEARKKSFFKERKKEEEKNIISLYLYVGFFRASLVWLVISIKGKENFALFYRGCRSHTVTEPRISCVLFASYVVFLSLHVW